MLWSRAGRTRSVSSREPGSWDSPRVEGSSVADMGSCTNTTTGRLNPTDRCGTRCPKADCTSLIIK
jgi:hypothetical protein